MTTTSKQLMYAISALCWMPAAMADYKTDIGYSQLQSLLGVNTPNGAGVKVTQVEASEVAYKIPVPANYPIYAPNTSSSQFVGKNFSFPGASASTGPSGHATTVAGLFYGNNAVAAGVSTIASYEVNDWITGLLYNTVAASANDGSRIANHSWVGNGANSSDTGLMLRLVDRQVQRNEFIQVVAMANGTANSPLLGSAYNVIAVGRTDGVHDKGTDAVDSVYVAGRASPDLVAPQSTTSAATPLVSAAAAVLVQTGHNGGSSLSKGSINVAGVGTVYNAERAETIKAVLMAGADRATQNTSTAANIIDYRSVGHQTSNGLDDRFGAGQVNVFNSYQIIAAGEQNSLQDGGVNAGFIGLNGFDYDAAFGGAAASNSVATYKFHAASGLNLSASLVWNLGVSDNVNLTTTLHNLDLELFDSTTQSIAAFSSSTVDNTENLWLSLMFGHDYELRVKAAENTSFSWDYSLAWHMTPITTSAVPVPTAWYLFMTGLAGLGWNSRRKV